MERPVIAFIVMIIGSAPAAWSSPSLLRRYGIPKPKPVAIVMVMTREHATARLSPSIPCHIKEITPAIVPTIRPIDSPTNNSFLNAFQNSLGLMCPKTKALVKIVLDCVPVFPPISMIIGINIAADAKAAKVFSKAWMTEPQADFPQA